MEEIIYICVYLNNSQLALYQGGTDLNCPQTRKHMYAHTHTNTHTNTHTLVDLDTNSISWVTCPVQATQSMLTKMMEVR